MKTTKKILEQKTKAVSKKIAETKIAAKVVAPPPKAVDPRKFVIYHNPRCSKSREALEILRVRGVVPKIVEYLKNPPSATELDSLLKQMGLKPEEIVRTSEDRYVDLDLASNPPKTRSAWVKLLSENPVLIERPIVTDGKKAVLGRPPLNVQKLFS